MSEIPHAIDDGFKSCMGYQLPDTLYRPRQFRRALEQRSESIKSALSDHFGHLASIYCHIDEKARSQEHTQTDSSVIIDLTNRKLRATCGHPCEATYGIYQLGGSA